MEVIQESIIEKAKKFVANNKGKLAALAGLAALGGAAYYGKTHGWFDNIHLPFGGNDNQASHDKNEQPNHKDNQINNTEQTSTVKQKNHVAGTSVGQPTSSAGQPTSSTGQPTSSADQTNRDNDLINKAQKLYLNNKFQPETRFKIVKLPDGQTFNSTYKILYSTNNGFSKGETEAFLRKLGVDYRQFTDINRYSDTSSEPISVFKQYKEPLINGSAANIVEPALKASNLYKPEN